MVERSKKPLPRKAASSSRSRARSRPSTFEREQAVLFESMRSDFRVFGEALQGFDAKLQGFDARLQGFDARLQGFDARLEGFDVRLQGLDANLQSFREEVDARFDRVDTRLDRVDRDVALLKDAVVTNTGELKNVQIAVARKVDRAEVEAVVERVVRQTP